MEPTDQTQVDGYYGDDDMGDDDLDLSFLDDEGEGDNAAEAQKK